MFCQNDNVKILMYCMILTTLTAAP